MREITQFANYTLEIWRRPRQRHMRLTVRPDGRVRVTCNRKLSKHAVLAFVEESREFIARRHSELAQLKAQFPRKTYLSGETFLYFGERRRLELVWTWEPRVRVTATPSALEMLAPIAATVEARAKAMRAFYRQQAEAYFKARVAVFAARMRLYPSALRVRGQTTRWGSCSSTRQVSLNLKLICAPPAVIDYVVIHELAHLQHMDHSPRFWRLVAEFAPDYRSAKAWLKAHEPEIAAQFLH